MVADDRSGTVETGWRAGWTRVAGGGVRSARAADLVAVDLDRARALSLLVLLAGTAVLYLWNLGASGWANAYYSAAAMAGAQNPLAWLFGSFDAGNAVTIDKTPAAMWVMSLSVRLFGLSPWSVLVPQALMGVGAVALVYLTVRRVAGHLGGLVAGATLALTPVAALMFRFNNPDALLVLLLVASAYATVRAIETGSTRWLVIAGVAVGFGFLAKLLQAFLIIPALSAAYLVAAPPALPTRIRQVAVAALAVVVSGGWYLALVELWPAAARPFVGGSQSNSIIDLLLNYDGFGRILGNEVGRVGGGQPFGDGAGPLRLLGGQVATQIAWLLPVALIALAALLWMRRFAARTDPLRAQTLLWGGWLVVTALVFSLMRGIFHEYYTVALAPAVGALVGIGVAVAWRRRHDASVAVLAAATVGVSVLWAQRLLTLSPGWNPWLSTVLLVGGVLAVGAILAARILPGRGIQRAALAAAVAVLLLTPAIASVATAAEPHSGALPLAEPRAQLQRNGAGFAGRRMPFGAFGPGLGGLFGNGNGGANGGNGGGANGGGGIGGNGGGPFGLGPLGPMGPGNGGFGGIGGIGGFGGRFGGRFGGQFPGFGQGGAGAGRAGLGGLLDAGAADPELVRALQADADRYTWTAATTGANNAAGLALSSRTSVMAIGGFNGTDPTPTLEQFQADVAQGRIHYYVAGPDAGGFRGAIGGSNDAARIASWVRETFAPTTIGSVTVYDLTGGS